MNEEKKEEIKDVTPPAPAEKTSETPAAVSAPAQEQPAAAKAEIKAEVKKEKPSNCGGCKKSIKKKRWYYRDGKYYCSKRCFKTTLKKEDKKEEPKA